LLCLAAWFAASRRRIPALLKELLFSSGKNKLLSAIAACQQYIGAVHSKPRIPQVYCQLAKSKPK
jgi:hypothetical protein